MNKDQMNQIIFNALETEHSRSKSEEYKDKVKNAMQAFRKSTEEDPHGVCRECGSMDISKPTA